MKQIRIFQAAILTVGLGCGWIWAQIDSPIGAVYQKMANMTGDLRIMRTALATYEIDNNAFPVSTDQTGEPGRTLGVPTFARTSIDNNAKLKVYSLTTPVAYLSSMILDQFSEKASQPFAYATTGSAYLIWSTGPDNNFDLTASDFNLEAEKQSAEFHARYSYDPSNGLTSSGDLWFSRGDQSAILSTLEAKSKAKSKEKPGTSLGVLGFLHEMASVAKTVTPATKLEDAKANLRKIATALEIYYIDNSAYPVFTTSTEEQIGPTALPADVPTFHTLVTKKFNGANKSIVLFALTTPIAYLTAMPEDPYSKAKAPFAYVNRGETAWLLWSPGPDGEYDVDLNDFKSDTVWPAPDFIAKYAYDVSNGTVSSGDVLRLKQQR